MGEDSHVPALSRRVPGATKWPTPVTRATPPALPEAVLERMRAATEVAGAVTAPIPVITAALGSDLASPAVEEISVQPDRTAQPDRPAQPDRTALPHRTAQPDRPAQPDHTALPRRAAEAPADYLPVAAPRGRAERRASGGQGSTGRRKHAAAALVSALVLIAIGSVTFVLARHVAASAAHSGHGASADAHGADAAARNLAAAWVARQVSQAAIVSCDQAMCQALTAHGFPVGNLLELSQGAASPLHSDVIIATADVRGQFGSRLGSVLAPAVIASFGSGDLRVDIRQIAPNGAAAYAAAVSADLAARKVSGAELLHSQRILVMAAARKQLSAGQVDSRLLITLAGMAALHPVTILAFGDSGPGAGAGIPLRSADLADTGAVPGGGSSAYLRSMLAFLNALPFPYLPAHAGAARLASGQTVLRIEFAAPSPLGLLNPPAP